MGIPEPLQELLSSTEDTLMRIEYDLQRDANTILDRVKRTKQHVKQGLHINDLGELQGAAPQFDIQCALRSQAVANIKRTAYYIAKVAGLESVPTILDAVEEGA